MKLYKRDYTKLTDQEIAEWEEIKKKEVSSHNRVLNPKSNQFTKYPRAVRHYESLFPNNYIDPVQLKEENELKSLVAGFESLLEDKEKRERDVLNYINNHENRNIFFMIASLVKYDYDFGHHELFVFPEFSLGTNHKVDYLVVGRKSGGYEFVFIELEKPYKRITLKNGELGEAFNKGINQIDDWIGWLSANFSSLREEFKKHLNPNRQLPIDFIEGDLTRVHFVVIAGRRDDFTNITYRKKRSLKSNSKLNLLHYDNLIDFSYSIIGNENY